jgi:polyketide cyclase/dehydrase/lipid transport protein
LSVRVRLERRVEVAVPAAVLWDYVTDWPRQAEWVPMTRVERVDAADGLGGRLRAWTGVGPVGFWDPMTITLWQRDAQGGGRCEVLHRGRVVRGEGEFSVLARGPEAGTFVWAEVLVVPGGRPGALAFRLARPAVERLLDAALRGLRRRVEAAERPRTG